MRAGLLTEVITIEQPIVILDEFGANLHSWLPIIRTRAAVNYSNGNRVNLNNEVVFAYDVIFKIRVYHCINERMRIIWKSKKYRILAIEEDRQLQQLIIKTELINE